MSHLQDKIEKKWIWLKCIKCIRKKINLETYLLFLRERTLLLLHIELGKFQDFISFLFSQRLRWMFLLSLFLMETYSLHFMSSILLLYGVCGCFLLWLFWMPFSRRPRMNLMALFMIFGRVGSLYPAKWKLFGETQHRLAYFPQICGMLQWGQNCQTKTEKPLRVH